MSPSYSYVKATEPVTGQRAKRVASLLDLMADSEEPLPFDEACEQLGISQPSQLLPAMYALEFVGAIERHTYVARAGTRSRLAYKFTEAVEVIDTNVSEPQVAVEEPEEEGEPWTWADVKAMGKPELIATIEEYGIDARTKRVKVAELRKALAYGLGVEVPA